MTTTGDIEDDDLLAANILLGGVQHAQAKHVAPQPQQMNAQVHPHQRQHQACVPHNPVVAGVHSIPPTMHGAQAAPAHPPSMTYSQQYHYGMNRMPQQAPQYAYGTVPQPIHNGNCSEPKKENQSYVGTSNGYVVASAPPTRSQSIVTTVASPVHEGASPPQPGQDPGRGHRSQLRRIYNGAPHSISPTPSTHMSGHSQPSYGDVVEEQGQSAKSPVTMRTQMFHNHRTQVLKRGGRKRTQSEMQYSSRVREEASYNHDDDNDQDDMSDGDGSSQRDVAQCIMELMKTSRERMRSVAYPPMREDEVDENMSPISPRGGGRKRANTISGTSCLPPRNVHNAKEQKRRNDIRDAFEDLRRKLPATEMNVSKSEILRKACEHIQLLKERDIMLQREAGALSVAPGEREKRKTKQRFGLEKMVVAAA